ncbi:MAG: M24 family metallopeptidase [Ignavibacteriaceae bacterium]|nr:M24 family metallopeptidase [Ignavibacteriaceae bacterium]
MNQYLEERIKQLESLFERLSINGLYLSSRSSAKHFADFHGSSSLILLFEGERYFFTDPRYSLQVQHLENLFNVKIVSGSISGFIKDKFKKGIIGLEGDAVTLNQYNTLVDEFKKINFVNVSDSLNLLFSIKDSENIFRIKEAIKIAESAYKSILESDFSGVSEKEAEAKLVYFLRHFGSTEEPFNPIVTAGSRSADIHGSASSNIIKPGENILYDFGAVFKGLCCDVTRNIKYFENDEYFKVHEIIELAVNSAEKLIKPGIKTAEIDKAVREVFREYEFENYFNHSTGHGFGYEVHQIPRISIKSDEILRTGQTITIEPGIYLPGKFGIRIENNYLITDNGFEKLTNF